MKKELARIKTSAIEDIAEAASLEGLEAVRRTYLGRKGTLTAILRALKDLPEKERAVIGEEANSLRESIDARIAKRREALKKELHAETLKREWLDSTLAHPKSKKVRGHVHPIIKIRREIESIFLSLGFDIVEGPEIETEYYNFDALNLPDEHPAREMQDTIWLKDAGTTQKRTGRAIYSRLLMRAQVTAIQVRFMEKHNPPFRIVMPGAVFRREATDASHEMQFYQMDGLMVDKHVSLADLKGIMEGVMQRLFGRPIKTRLRPSYFPFVEPAVEMDMECLNCKQKGCSICQQTGWIEVLPGGMVHPHVFKEAGYNPKEWQGIAFDFGLDRLAMMKYNIPDIRLFHSGDMRFLEQF